MWQCSPMEAPWQKRLVQLMTQRGLTAAGLSKLCGNNNNLIPNMLRDGHSPTLRKLTVVAEALGVSVADLIEPARGTAQSVPIVGVCVSGEEWQRYDTVTKHIDMTGVTGHAIGVEVRTTALIGFYRPGDVIIGVEHNTLPPSVNNLSCIIETADQQRLIRLVQVKPGTDLVTLRSHIVEAPDMIGVKLAWAAPVQWVRRTTA